MIRAGSSACMCGANAPKARRTAGLRSVRNCAVEPLKGRGRTAILRKYPLPRTRPQPTAAFGHGAAHRAWRNAARARRCRCRSRCPPRMAMPSSPAIRSTLCDRGEGGDAFGQREADGEILEIGRARHQHSLRRAAIGDRDRRLDRDGTAGRCRAAAPPCGGGDALARLWGGGHAYSAASAGRMRRLSSERRA